MKNLLHVVRKRIRILIVVNLLTFSGVLAYTFLQPPLYRAVAEISFPIENHNRKSGVKTLNTCSDILKSHKITTGVLQQLEANEKQYPRFLAPYQNSYKMGENSTEVLHDLLHQNRKILPNRHDHTIQVAYQHPDREIAANIANLYHRSYQNYIIQLGANHHGLTSYDQTQHQTELERIPQQRSEYLISNASLFLNVNQ